MIWHIFSEISHSVYYLAFVWGTYVGKSKSQYQKLVSLSGSAAQAVADLIHGYVRIPPTRQNDVNVTELPSAWTSGSTQHTSLVISELSSIRSALAPQKLGVEKRRITHFLDSSIVFFAV